MLTPDETKILIFLRHCPTATFDALSQACRTAPELLSRVLTHLEWFNYVVVYHNPRGEPAGVQITERGLRLAAV
jgi:hypothetical protein